MADLAETLVDHHPITRLIGPQGLPPGAHNQSIPITTCSCGRDLGPTTGGRTIRGWARHVADLNKAGA